MYTTLDELSAAIAPILANTDFEAIGKIAEHKESKPDEPKGYMSSVLSFTGNEGIVIGGERFYPSRIQVGINAMRLSAAPRVRDETREPKAATSNSSALKSLLSRPTVVAVPASKV